MAPFVGFVILTGVPLIIWMLLNLIVNRAYDSDKSLEAFERFLKMFANMGFGNTSGWILERDYKNPNANSEVHRILYLKNREIGMFEKINKNEFWNFADEVWVCNNVQELYIKIAHQDFDTEGSIWVKEDSNNQVCTFSYLNEQDEKIKQIIETRKVKVYEAFQKQKQRHPQIKLNPNDILPPEIIYYYEPRYDQNVNQYIQKNIESIDTALSNNGYTLMYLPRLLAQLKDIENGTIEYASYTMPALRVNTIDALVKELKTKEESSQEIFKYLLEQAIGMPTIDAPCFIRCVEDGYAPEFKEYKYSVFPLIEEADESIEQKIDFYCKVVGKKEGGPQYRLATPDESDPDDYFFYLDRLIDPVTKNAIDGIKKMNDQKMLFSSMAYMINTLKESHPELCKKLNSTLYDALSENNIKISRLVIDKQYRLFLPDFNNLEIELGPLPKTIFIFLLKHPEGVLFKELRQYSKELIEIYTKVGNRLDMVQIEKSIKELTDPRSNSINEKCSRIKEAFLSKIDDSIAKQYYVTGDRSSNKGIKLDRTLVQFH